MKLIDRVIWIMGIIGVLLLVVGFTFGLGFRHVVEVRPDRVRAGNTVELRVNEPPGTWGLYWTVQRREGFTWREFGYAVAGPNSKDALIQAHTGDPVAVHLIGFEGSATIELRVADDIPDGRYRIGQDFTPDGPGSYEERSEWHWAHVRIRK